MVNSFSGSLIARPGPGAWSQIPRQSRDIGSQLDGQTGTKYARKRPTEILCAPGPPQPPPDGLAGPGHHSPATTTCCLTRKAESIDQQHPQRVNTGHFLRRARPRRERRARKRHQSRSRVNKRLQYFSFCGKSGGLRGPDGARKRLHGPADALISVPETVNDAIGPSDRVVWGDQM